MSVVFFFLGLVLLILGANWLISGASSLAVRFGVSPLIIGLTIVAFGTSAPELAVSIKAALSDQADIAMGNVVGSNIFNILFILGMSALIVPLVVAERLIRVDVPIMIALSIGLYLLALDGELSRWNGALLVFLLVSYTVWLFRSDQGDSAENVEAQPLAKSLLLVALGLVCLVMGSRFLVQAAVDFARVLGVSELVVGLTIIAAGTSLPEVVTSLLAALKGQRDIAVGNVVGSNIFNILGVLGITSVVSGTGVSVQPAMLQFDLPVMMLVALLALPVFFSHAAISRGEGVAFLILYVLYTSFLVLSATGTVASYQMALMTAGIATVVILMVSFLLAVWQQQKQKSLR